MTLRNLLEWVSNRESTVPVELYMNFSILFSVLFKQDSPDIWFLILSHTVKYIWFDSLICESADSNQHIFIVFIPETLQQSSTFCFLTHRKSLKNCEPNLNRLTESLLNSQTVSGNESHRGHKYHIQLPLLHAAYVSLRNYLFNFSSDASSSVNSE